MPDDPTTHVDVQELMREVQRRARTPKDQEDLTSGTRPPEHSLHGHYDLVATPLEPPRRGLGQIKNAVRRVLARLLLPVLHRQTVFNVAVVAGMDEATLRTMQLESEIGRLERQLAAQKSLAERLEQLSVRVRRLDGGPPFVDQFAMQERFRGAQEEVKDRQRKYLQFFRAGGRVLDLGSGRGEFLELMRELGAPAQGVDYDLHNVLHCRDKGLDVIHGDAFAVLEQLPDGALDGIFCAQFVEHFPPPRIVHLTDLAARKLAPNGVAIFETLNPACLSVFAHSYYLDFTHVWPYHPEALTFVMQAAGFTGVRQLFSTPLDPEARFPLVRDLAVFGAETEMYNRAATLVNRLLLGPQDYAVIGRKPIEPS